MQHLRLRIQRRACQHGTEARRDDSFVPECPVLLRQTEQHARHTRAGQADFVRVRAGGTAGDVRVQLHMVLFRA